MTHLVNRYTIWLDTETIATDLTDVSDAVAICEHEARKRDIDVSHFSIEIHKVVR